MGLWGITDARDMDPVLDLLLDVFAYESFKLHEYVEDSDAKILSRLSRILVASKWSLPKPAHALMSVSPNKGECGMLDAEDHFYAEKLMFGTDEIQAFFTPLYSHELIDAKVSTLVSIDSLRTIASDGKDFVSEDINLKGYVSENALWLGIDIEEESLENLKELTLCVLPNNWDTMTFLKAFLFYDVNGNRIECHNGIDKTDSFGNAHYFSEIKDFYNDMFFNLKLEKDARKKHTIKERFPSLAEDDFGFMTGKPLLWIRIDIPEIFSLSMIDGLKVFINTFPVVNRKLVCQQHNFKTNGGIIPLYGDSGCRFLNVRCIQDDLGRIYTDRAESLEASPTGVFSLYFGDLERFDSVSAKSLIIKLLQLIREEGNSFASMKPDTLTSQLKSLFDKVNSLEKELGVSTADSCTVKAFALTIPTPGATYGEIKYWDTIGETANGFTTNSLIHQFNMDKFDGSTIYFRTGSTGGRQNISEQDLVRSLRYGLLTKDRIVSKEDIYSFIYHKIGNYVDSIDICDGVSLSPDPKKGIIRITEVHIKLNGIANEHTSNHRHLSYVLEKELASRSVIGSIYKVFFL